MWEIKIYFYYVIFKFCLYLNLWYKSIFEKKKKRSILNRENPLNSSIYGMYLYYFIIRVWSVAKPHWDPRGPWPPQIFEKISVYIYIYIYI